MAKHEFGIMDKSPVKGERYDEYEPGKYNCVEIHDDFIENILENLQGVECYYHSVDIKGKGLNYSGITLIPPESMDEIVNILHKENRDEYNELMTLLKTAGEKGKYIIHYGI